MSERVQLGDLWADVMRRMYGEPEPVRFRTTITQSTADEGRETYRIEHPADPSPARLPGDAHGP